MSPPKFRGYGLTGGFDTLFFCVLLRAPRAARNCCMPSWMLLLPTAKENTKMTTSKPTRFFMKKVYPPSRGIQKSPLLQAAPKSGGDLEGRNLLKIRRLDSSCPFFLSENALCPSIPWFLGFPWFILGKEFPFLFWYFLSFPRKKTKIPGNGGSQELFGPMFP